MTQEDKEQECKKCGRVFGSVRCFDVDCPNNTPKITMSQEHKELLLKDLCARLPYGVILNCCNLVGEKLYTIDSNGLVNNDYDLEEVKPYLFPLSSMTDEQYENFLLTNSKITLNGVICSTKGFDFLNKHHFDYRGLIYMGLANDATGLNIY